MANEIVKYENTLNAITLSRFNANENNIFFAIASRVRGKQSAEVTFDFDYLKKISNYHRKESFVKYLKSMLKKLESVEIEDDGVYSKFFLFSKYQINGPKQKLTVAVNGQYIGYFNRLNHWTRFSLEQFTSLSSTYSKAIFRILKQYRTVGRYEFTTHEFRSRLEIPKSYRASHINSRVLKIVKEELAPIFPGFSITKKRKGRQIVKYIFTWHPEGNKVNDFTVSSSVALSTALRNIENNQDLTQKEKWEAEDRVRGLSIGTTEQELTQAKVFNTDGSLAGYAVQNANQNNKHEKSEVSSWEDQLRQSTKKMTKRSLSKLINQLSNKPEDKRSEKEEVAYATYVVELRRRELDEEQKELSSKSD